MSDTASRAATGAAGGLRRVGVYCGSHLGHQETYRETAREMGEVLLELGLGLVYGGGNVGLMGVIADTMIGGGGEVIGVIPKSLEDREVAHRGLSELIVVDGMHVRKRTIYELMDAAVAMPGGIGTFDELFETLTWNQLEIHYKPTGLLNAGGYFDPLVAMLDRAVEEGFVRAPMRRAMVVSDSPRRLVDGLMASRRTAEQGWVKPPSGEALSSPRG